MYLPALLFPVFHTLAMVASSPLGKTTKVLNLSILFYFGFSGPNEQVPLNQLLAEEVSLYALKVKVLVGHYLLTHMCCVSY